MFEATATAIPALFSKTDFFLHTERAVELGKIQNNPLHPLQSMAAPYITLSGLSRRARYIQIAERFPVSPIKEIDLETAIKSFEVVKETVEKVFAEHHSSKIAPWSKHGDSEK